MSLTAGPYDYIVTDNNGCVDVASVVINAAPPVLSGSVASTNVTCNGASDGTITVTLPMGGYGTYEYRLNTGTWQMGGSFTGLAPGVYSVQIRDAAHTACAITLSSVMITEPTVVGGSVASTNVTCNGAADGTITVTATGGYGTYQYTINGGGSWQSMGVYTGVAPGTYDVRVRDAAHVLCTATIDAALVITEPTVVGGSVASTNVTCNGAADGTITVTATGGYGTYQYTINGGGSWQSMGVYTGVAPGTYDVRVRDAAHVLCTATINAALMITQPTVLNATVASTNATCYGLNNGTITISSPTGGYGTYQYSINGGGSWQASGSYMNLPAPATYNVQIRDAANPTCVIILNGALNITQPPQISVNPITGSNYVYVNNTTQLANTTPLPMGWSAVWGSSDVMKATVSNTGLVFGVAQGMATISYTVTDANGCTNSATFAMNINIPVINIGIVNYVALSPAGNKLKVRISPTLNIVNGVYSEGVFTVKTPASVTLSVLAAPTIGGVSYVLNHVALNDLGSNYYTFNYNNDSYPANVVNWTANQQIDVLTLGYSCTTPGSTVFEIVQNYTSPPYVVDPCSPMFPPCPQTVVAVGDYYQELNAGGAQNMINPPTAMAPVPLSLSTTQIDEWCNSLGSIDLTAMNGEPSYTYNWGGGITTEDRTALSAGTYTVTVTDATGCTATTAPTILYLPVTNTSNSTHFATIQAAISAPTTVDGNIIDVCAGTYNENIQVTKALTLNGANINEEGCGGRGAESILNGTAGSNTKTVDIQSDGVTVNGFTISNPLGSYGVYAKRRNNTTVLYNIITNVGNNTSGSLASYGIAIDMDNSIAPINGVNLSYNCINNIRGGQTGPTGGGNGSAAGIGVGFSAAAHNITNAVISHNTISDISASTTNGSGGKGAYGLLMNAGASNAGQVVSPTIDYNSIYNLNGRWAHGVGLEGKTPGAMVLNNDVHDFSSAAGDAVGVVLEANSGASTVEIHRNSFKNMTTAIQNKMMPTVNAECNWYDSPINSVIATKILGPVDYDPWQTNGTDANTTAVGFVPTAPLCDGTPVVITSTVPDHITCGESFGSITVNYTGGVGTYTVAWMGPVSGSANMIAGLTYTTPVNLPIGLYNVTVSDIYGSSAISSTTILYLPVTNTSTSTYYATIQAAVTAAAPGNSISVCAGTYNEDVNIDKQLTLTGAGYSSTTISGPIGGINSTVQVAAAGVVIDGFTITRDGNTVAQWNLALNTAGVAIQTQGNYAEVRNCKFYGNRTGIDINNSNGNNIHNNLIDNNRTGMIFRNQTDNTNVQNNYVTNNWTIGILFLDGSGAGVPIQSALNSTFNNNYISGNWGSEVQDRQTGGALPAPGANGKNFDCNWYGAASMPTTNSVNSVDPVYATQIPVIFGGSSVPPGGSVDIAGAASANIDFVSWLVDGNDADMNPLNGFQPGMSVCSGTPIVITLTMPDNIICLEPNTSSIAITFSGGTPNYTYNWTRTEGGTGMGTFMSAGVQTISGLLVGNYSITITDINGTMAVTTAQIQYLPVTNTSTTTYYPTIQAAVTAATAGNTIAVCAGTYTENVVVNKALTILGVNAGTPGCASRPTESTIAGGAGAAVTITADGVTLDGFELTGVTGVASTGFTNTRIRNNKMSVGAVGVNAANVPTSAGNTLTVEYNCINVLAQTVAGPTPTAGVLINGAAGSHAIVLDHNTVTNGFYGYIMSSVNTTAASVVSNGTVTGVLQGVAVVNTIGAAPAASNVVVQSMNMSAFSGNYPSLPNNNYHAGVSTFTTATTVPSNGITLAVNNCTINGTQTVTQSSAGISLGDFSTGGLFVQNVTITECSIVDNTNRGLDVRGYVSALVTRSSFTHNGGAAFGAGGNDGFTILAQKGAIVTATNNFIEHPVSSTTQVIALQTGNAPNSVLTATDNSILMNGNAQGKGAVTGSGNISATCNWWGTSNVDVFELRIFGGVTFAPYLNSGMDNDGGTPGFQPAPGTCVPLTKFYVNDNDLMGDIFTTAVGSDVLPGTRGTKNRPYRTVMAAQSAAAVGNTIRVDVGTFDENITVNKQNLTILGASRNGTVLRGSYANPTPQENATLAFRNNLADGATVRNLTVTRDFQDWYNSTKNYGVLLSGGVNNVTLDTIQFINNRTGVYVENNAQVNLSHSVILNNRTGLFITNTVRGSVTNNIIHDNQTHGVFYDMNDGTSNLTGFSFNDNSLYGNWYSQMLFRGGNTLVPGSPTSNFECNWFGTDMPTLNPVNPVEGGYGALVPQVFGGTSAQGTYSGEVRGNGAPQIDYVSFTTGQSMNVSDPYVPTMGSCNGVYPVNNISKNIGYFTIQNGVNGADNGNSITVASGSYNEQVLVNKSLNLTGVGVTKPIIDFTGTVTGKPTLFDISANGVTVDRFQFNTNLSKLSSAIIASAVALDNITVQNSMVTPYKSLPSYFGTYADRNAISINYGGDTDYRVASGGVNSIIIDNNMVSATVNGVALGDDAADIGFRAAVAVDEGAGTYTRNTFQTINHDIIVRFNSNGPITIGGLGMGNTFNGGGVTIAEQNAGGGAVDISYNTFDGAVSYSVLRLQNNQQHKVTTVNNNTFNNLRWGISLENYPDATIATNTFSPLSGYTTFRHITVNTKSLSSNSSTIVQVPIDAVIKGNTFNSLLTTGGTALAFYNHDSDNAAYNPFTIGTSMEPNMFGPNFSNFAYMGNQTGLTLSALGAFPEYNLGAGSNTTMACWNYSINIEKNKFDVGAMMPLFPIAMTGTYRAVLEGKLFHKPDNSCLGEFIYFQPVKVRAKVFLQGPYDTSTIPPHLMGDALRQIVVAPLFPTMEPYSQYNTAPYNYAFVPVDTVGAKEQTTAGVLAVTGNNAIVDWVFLELRDPTNRFNVLATRSALLQRDGDIVDMDGISPVTFPNSYLGEYYLMVRHRNHLGAMTDAKVDYLANPNTVVDFTSPSLVSYGTVAPTATSARVLVEPGVYGLWAGNVNLKSLIGNFQVQYLNPGNDPFPILVRVGTSTPLNVVPGYYLEDVNLNGSVKYSGGNNDRVIILNNVGPTTPFNIITQQPPN